MYCIKVHPKINMKTANIGNFVIIYYYCKNQLIVAYDKL